MDEQLTPSTLSDNNTDCQNKKEEIQIVPIKDIIVSSEKMQRSHEDKELNSLAESINATGLINPITINSNFELISGYIRLKACEKLGMTSIMARVVDIDLLKNELMKCDENLARIQLGPIERAGYMKKRQEVYEKLYPQSKRSYINSINASKRNNFVSQADEKIKTFTKDTAEISGKSQRSVQQDLQIANNITEETIDIIKDSNAETKDNLLELSRLSPTEQLETAKEMVANANKPKEKTKEHKPLALIYKVDFVNRTVVVDDKWLNLPQEYDMDKNSYENMKAVAKNYLNNNSTDSASSSSEHKYQRKMLFYDKK